MKNITVVALQGACDVTQNRAKVTAFNCMLLKIEKVLCLNTLLLFAGISRTSSLNKTLLF